MNTALAAALERKFDYLVALDYETYYDSEYTLSKMTTADYIRDPRYETIGCGVKVKRVKDAPGKTEWLDPRAFAEFASRAPWDRCAVLAHHTHFDGYISAYHYGVNPIIWLDTLSMARMLHGLEVGNSLAKLMPYYGVGVKGDYVTNAKGKHLRDFMPEEYAAYGRYCCTDVDGCFDIFHKMLRNGFPEVSLWSIDNTIRMYTEPSLVIDEPLLKEYLSKEREKKAALLERIAKEKDVLLSNDKFAALLVGLGIDPPLKVSAAKTKKAREKDPEADEVLTYSFAKTDPGMQYLLEHDRDEVRWVAEARVGIKSTINETRTERFLRSGAGGRRLPVYLKWAAAHTHRWGGGDKMNFQNLERTDKDDPTKGVLRKSLKADVGETLVVVDSGQIEARVTGWLAGHTFLLDAFRRNDATDGDVYAEFGTSVFQRPITKKDTPIERQIAKNMVLGLGFGMGWYKFAGELLKGMLGADPVQFTYVDAEKFLVDVESFEQEHGDRVRDMHAYYTRLAYEELLVHCAVAKHFVDLYRERNRPITQLWKNMDLVLGAMDLGTEALFGPGGCLKTIRHGVVLPNGHTLRYPGLGHRESGDNRGYSYMGGNGGRERVKAYGGSMTENIVQALAKIIVEEQLLWLRPWVRKHGGRQVTMSHDEGVFAVPEEYGGECLARAMKEMRQSPAWARDLPLNASGGVGKCYGEVK